MVTLPTRFASFFFFNFVFLIFVLWNWQIGTLQLAIAAQYFGVPFFAAVPTTTFDLSMASGATIPVEERPGHELTRYVKVLNLVLLSQQRVVYSVSKLRQVVLMYGIPPLM